MRFPLTQTVRSITAHWWQAGVIYQIYPRSFQDTDSDGVGDLRGIIQRLSYLAELGVDAIWISPIFTSPMADFGYDIANYTDIDPLFGTLADFDALLDSAHNQGIKVILDLVPNHTSDRHAWFIDSRSARTSDKRDWYLWHDPGPGGEPPNNWLSEFGGSAWTYDEVTRQYFYHAFLPEQPDLNWRNPQVRAAIYDVMRFWLRRGVDGFRVDVIWHLIKDEAFRDNPPNPAFRPDEPPHHAWVPLYTTDRPEIHAVISEMRRVIDEFPDRLLIGEIYLPLERLIQYYGRDLAGLHLPFNFSLLSAAWDPQSIAKLVEEYEAALPPGGWPNWVLGNHDRRRIASRVGDAQARIAAMLLLTLRGTPTIYYGDEIGMQDVAIPRDRIRDVVERNISEHGLGRDRCRTPMQWDATRFAGFSEHEPWLPMPEAAHHENVENQRRDGTSFLSLYRRLIALRRSEPALQLGSYRAIYTRKDAWLFLRELDDARILIALNMGSEPTAVAFTSDPIEGRILLSTYLDREGEEASGSIDLRSHEGVAINLWPPERQAWAEATQR
jgi:alpha-glucosidase